jgi:hypothetical protein
MYDIEQSIWRKFEGVLTTQQRRIDILWKSYRTMQNQVLALAVFQTILAIVVLLGLVL